MAADATAPLWVQKRTSRAAYAAQLRANRNGAMRTSSRPIKRTRELFDHFVGGRRCHFEFRNSNVCTPKQTIL